MALDNPLTSLRLLVGSALTAYAPFVTAIGGERNVQIWDRANDVRGDLTKTARAKYRAQMRPAEAAVDFDWSSSSIKFERRYAVEIYTKGAEVKPIEYFEWLIWKAIAYLFMRRQPGTANEIVEPAPLDVHKIIIAQADPDRENFDGETEDWTNICDIIAKGSVTIAALTTE